MHFYDQWLVYRFVWHQISHHMIVNFSMKAWNTSFEIVLAWLLYIVVWKLLIFILKWWKKTPTDAFSSDKNTNFMSSFRVNLQAQTLYQNQISWLSGCCSLQAFSFIWQSGSAYSRFGIFISQRWHLWQPLRNYIYRSSAGSVSFPLWCRRSRWSIQP